MINLACSSEGEELTLFQHPRSAKTLYKFLKAWQKIISVQRHYLIKNVFVACMERQPKPNPRYDSLSQKYQGTSGQVLTAFDGISFLLV